MKAATALAQPPAHRTRTRIRSLDLLGPAGRLEAVVNEGDENAPLAALVCHPHPLGGGNLHNKTVFHTMKVLNEPRWGFNFPVLRFNFRGTGKSQGEHHGSAESGDVIAALRWLKSEYNRPFILAGFSFGAAMALEACRDIDSSSAEIRALIALGLPLKNGPRAYQHPALAELAIPKLFLSGDRDQFAPATELKHVVAATAHPKKLVFIQGSDHFFTGQMTAMQIQIAAWLKEQLQ